MVRRRDLNRHHIRARTTFPNDATKREMDENNIVELDRDFHEALHDVFGVLPPCKYEEFLRTVLTPDTRWDYRKLRDLRQKLLADFYNEQDDE